MDGGTFDTILRAERGALPFSRSSAGLGGQRVRLHQPADSVAPSAAGASAIGDSIWAIMRDLCI
jgi:hypothetical protein